MSTEEIAKLTNAAERAIKNNNRNEAVRHLRDIIVKYPDYAPAYAHLGALITNSQAKQEAFKLLSKAIELVPDNADFWAGLGHYHRRYKDLAKALASFSKSLELKPNNKSVMLEVLKIYTASKDNKSALKLAAKLFELDSKDPIVIDLYADLLDRTGESAKALQLLSQLVAQEQMNIPSPIVVRWFNLMVKFERNKEARKWLLTQIETNPQSIDLKLIYASSCTTDLDYDAALQILVEAHQLDPEHVRVNHDLAVVYRFQGQVDKALEHFEKLLKEDPYYTSALRVVGVEHKYNWGDDEFNRLNRAAAHIAELPNEKRVQMHYALGKAYDDVGDMATAFEHFKIGGRLHLKNVPYDRTIEQKLRHSIKTKMTRTVFQQHEKSGYKSEKPVFIVGMPRSGTSLIEQVLSNIPGVYGAGELKYVTSVLNQVSTCGFKIDFSHRRHVFEDQHNASYADRGAKYLELVEKLAPPDAVRIIDKMPANYSWLGFIHLILPDAKFIHSRRHPIETCLSAYRIFFPEGQYWSFDLKRMGQAYREYIEIMDIWKGLLPEGIVMDVRYEDMVVDLEAQSKRLAGHIGVEWDAACMAFHESDRPVRTASVVQVRQPIYTTSTNRWHKYEPYLKPLLDEIGDIVEAYEKECL